MPYNSYSKAKAVSRAIIASLLSLAMIISLTGCKPTDLFTEVILTPFVDKVDYKSEPVVVNSPDATKESNSLTALDWTDDSRRSEAEEILVTYNDEPTSMLTAHHSIFDLKPRFHSVMASDPVRLTFATDAELDHESEANDQDISAMQAVSRSVGGSNSTESNQAAPSNTAQDGDSTGDNATVSDSDGADDAGNNSDGESSNPDSSGSDQGSNNSDGSTENPYGGYNGVVDIYDPGNGFVKPNRVDHIAALGNDIAVMAQSIGGAGAICAMNEYAYYGLNSSGAPTTSYASFIDVFSGEIPVGFEQSGILWSADGSGPDTVKDIDALVAACGKKGLIVYDQLLGNAERLFNLNQRQRLQAAEIQLAPVDMSTVQGMLDAAQLIGEALQLSTECEQDSLAMSRSYINAVNNIVRSVAATNGGYLAAQHQSSLWTEPVTLYNSPPVTRSQYFEVFGLFATESESGLSYSRKYWDHDVNVSKVVLFGDVSAFQSPLSFWMQTAGVWDRSATSSRNPRALRGLTVFWPYHNIGESYLNSELTGGKSGGAWSRWLASRRYSANERGPVTGMMGRAESVSTFNGGYGLGSSEIPYLIVSASDGKSAGEVKDAVVDSMLSYDRSGQLSAYSIMPFGASGMPNLWPSENRVSDGSYIGTTNGELRENVFYRGLAVDEVVRENPVGLLGSWTEGSMESVLEAIWIADIYSRTPQNGVYKPITNMSRFAVNIGGETCLTTRDAVLQFYQTFYRCDASEAYNYIVTDEGVI